MEERVWIERRARTGTVIERTGPFKSGSPEALRATQHQMHIAASHNRSRCSDDPSRQLVYTVKPPYPFCRHPTVCLGAGYCRFDPACDD